MSEGLQQRQVRMHFRSEGVGVDVKTGAIDATEVGRHTKPVIEVSGQSTIPAIHVRTAVKVSELIATKYLCFGRRICRHCRHHQNHATEKNLTHVFPLTD